MPTHVYALGRATQKPLPSGSVFCALLGSGGGGGVPKATAGKVDNSTLQEINWEPALTQPLSWIAGSCIYAQLPPGIPCGAKPSGVTTLLAGRAMIGGRYAVPGPKRRFRS